MPEALNPVVETTIAVDLHALPYPSVPQLSVKDIAYAGGDERLRPFYAYNADLDGFKQAIEDRMHFPVNRRALVDALEKQYSKLATSPEVTANITALLDDSTFTVTTAHQPNLFTGPLYYIYKILSTINLAEQLQEAYPDKRFVPVFINSAEDHDFAELNHAFLFGKKITWESGEQGPIGHMQTASLSAPLSELQQILGDSPRAQDIFNTIKEAYTCHDTYAWATTHLVNALFQSYGLIVFDPNQDALKRLFIPIIKKEIFEQASKPHVEATTQALEKAGFSGQAYAREINFFYLSPQSRERLVKEGDHYEVLNTAIKFSPQEMEADIEAHPERFSPNVVTRPLYQEFLLPNLAYVGGGGEIAYWLERKGQFAHFGIFYPVLVRRNSVLWIDKGSAQRIEKLGLTPLQLFEDADSLIKAYIEKQAAGVLHLEDEKDALLQLFESIKTKAAKVDQTLVSAVMAEHAKQLKVVEQLEGRLMRAEKQRHETAVNQIKALKDKFFPGNGLQERQDNITAYYQKYGPAFIASLKAHLEPLRKAFIVLVEK